MSAPESPMTGDTNEVPLFFADSDEEDATMAEVIDSPARHSEPLFSAGSDVEDYAPPSSIAPLPRETSVETEDGPSVDAPPSSLRQAPSVLKESSSQDGRSRFWHADDDIVEVLSPAAKKRKLTPPSSHKSKSMPTTMYLGSFIASAWSTATGKGYIKNGDTFNLERDELENDPKPSSSSSSKTNGKATSDTKGKGKHKQLSLATMLKPAPKKMSNAKKSKDTVVRLVNDRKFEFARLSQKTAAWIAKLMDFGIVDFRGSTMVDCPASLRTGVDLIVSITVHIRASAFKPLTEFVKKDPVPKTMFNEGEETTEEQHLRERKASLLELFDTIGLRPRIGSDAMKHSKSEEQLHEHALKQMSQQPKKKAAKIEVVGDGEEVEVEEDEEELGQDELNMIYKRAQAHDHNMSEMDPADTFTLSLRGYQKQALCWMSSLERGETSAREANSMHPLWTEYGFPSNPVESLDDIIDLTKDDMPFYFNPYSGELSLEFPRAERICKGGILADEMGMGKTIMMSALIHSNKGPDNEITAEESREQRKSKQLKLNKAFRAVQHTASLEPSKGPCATLIVAPTSLLSQWAEELERSSEPGSVSVIVWHGQNRLDLEAAIEDEADGDERMKIVVTSYGVLASEHARTGKPSDVFEIEWLRVILDEAHNCKSRNSKTARAVYALRARRRWAVTGTPIVNKLEDLYSLLKFLDFHPWSDFSFFRSFITLPFLSHDPKAIEIVQVILESILLRREKNMRDSDGRKIVELPSKEVIREDLQFSQLERTIYDSIYTDVKRKFDQLNEKGLASKSYTHILAMIMRLRLAVLHPNLILPAGERIEPAGDGNVNVDALMKHFSPDGSPDGSHNVYAEEVLNNLAEGDGDAECPICIDVFQVPVILRGCLHKCCKDCILAYLETCSQRNEKRRCPTCLKGPIEDSDILEVVRRKKADPDCTLTNSQGVAPAVSLRQNDFRSSTKLEALVQNLRRLRDQDPCFRAVVFSQFTSFLDLVGAVLNREDLAWYRLDGSMDRKKRQAAVQEFAAPSRTPKVFIISLKAGGVGLNLTTANHVFMMDCWWNSAIENQAIDRVHRIGQEKTVYVRQFIVANTIEDRILKIQKRKTAIVKVALGGKGEENSDSLENLHIMFDDN